MVLVALVGMGLGMYQLFHLQKELAELREVSLAHGLAALAFLAAT
jgi:tumor necrosis factor ligand superfamily protein 6